MTGTYCASCGAERAPSASFCANCGARVAVPSAPQTASADATSGGMDPQAAAPQSAPTGNGYAGAEAHLPPAPVADQPAYPTATAPQATLPPQQPPTHPAPPPPTASPAPPQRPSPPQGPPPAYSAQQPPVQQPPVQPQYPGQQAPYGGP